MDSPGGEQFAKGLRRDFLLTQHERQNRHLIRGGVTAAVFLAILFSLSAGMAWLASALALAGLGSAVGFMLVVRFRQREVESELNSLLGERK